MNEYYVLKFGGTSQLSSTYEMIKERIKLDKQTKPNIKFVIILSAISGITNKLLEYINTKDESILMEIVNKNLELAINSDVNIKDYIEEFIKFALTIESLDDFIQVVSSGEFFTCNILTNYLLNYNLKAKFISSLDVIHSTIENNALYNKGEFNVEPSKILYELETNDVVIIPGFSGRTPNNKCCLLGRGGSDTTGSIIAASIDAKLYEIWTDVNGIYSSDPRIISNTFINQIINYEAAQEVAAMGAKVIHPYCILPCARKLIPIHIRNTLAPNNNSTIICEHSNNKVYAITIQDNVTLFKITSLNMWNNYGFVYDIFSIFKEHNVDVNIINTSQFNITTTTDEYDETKLNNIKNKLEEKYHVDVISNNSIVSIVGDNIRMNENIGNIFKKTKDFNILTTSYSSNDMSLSFVISSYDKIELAQTLHNIIFSSCLYMENNFA